MKRTKISAIIAFAVLACLITMPAKTGICQNSFYPAKVMDMSDMAYEKAVLVKR